MSARVMAATALGRTRPAMIVVITGIIVAMMPALGVGGGNGSVIAAAADDVAPAQLGLVAQDFAVAPGGRWRARFQITGELGEQLRALETRSREIRAEFERSPEFMELFPLVDPLNGYELVVTAHAPIDQRAGVQAADEGLLGAAIGRVRLALGPSLVPTDPGVTGDPGIGIAIDLATETEASGDPSRLTVDEAGVHPITIELVHNGAPVLGTTTFIDRIDPEASGTYRLAVVAGLEDPGPEPSAAERAALETALSQIAAIAENFDGPLTLEIPPIAASVTEQNRALRSRLSEAIGAAEILAAPAIPLDPSSVVAAAQTEAYIEQLRRGENLLGELLPTAALRRVALMSRTPISADGASLLRDLGTQALVMPMAEFARLQDGSASQNTDPSLLARAVLANGAAVDIAVIDPVSRYLGDDLAGEATPAARAVALLAELASEANRSDDTGRLAVLASSDLVLPDEQVLAALQPMVNTHPGFAFETLSSATTLADPLRIGGVPDEVVLAESAGPSLLDRVGQLDLGRLSLATYGSMLPSDDERLTVWSEHLDNWLSTAYDDPEVATRLAAQNAALTALAESLRTPDPFTFTLTGRSSELVLRIENTGDTALRAVLLADAPKLDFPAGPLDLVLEPGANEIVVPVQTLSNGTFPVTFQLVTPVGAAPIGEPLQLTARVNAVTGLGLVLTVGALLVLLSWWYNHLRNRNRRRSGDERAQGRRNHPSSRPLVEIIGPLETRSDPPATPATPTTPSSPSSPSSSSTTSTTGDRDPR